MTEKSISHNGKNGSEYANGGRSALRQEIQRAFDSDDLNLMDELGAEATPRQIRTWISRLEEIFAEKKERGRADIQGKVNDIISSNSYTLEELFGARILPTTDELAKLADSQEQ